jgi:hypothetical protein
MQIQQHIADANHLYLWFSTSTTFSRAGEGQRARVSCSSCRNSYLWRAAQFRAQHATCASVKYARVVCFSTYGAFIAYTRVFLQVPLRFIPPKSSSTSGWDSLWDLLMLRPSPLLPPGALELVSTNPITHAYVLGFQGKLGSFGSDDHVLTNLV